MDTNINNNKIIPYIQQVHYGFITPKNILHLSECLLVKIKEFIEAEIPDERVKEFMSDYIKGYFDSIIGVGIEISQRMKWYHYDSAFISKITGIDQKIVQEIEPVDPTKNHFYSHD